MGDETRQWRLWRQDDHGNEFPMGTFASHAEAEAERRRYAAKPHHQHYWVAEEAGRVRPLPDPPTSPS